MSRNQISLTDAERRVLDAESARTGLSVATLLRQAIDAAYGTGDSLESDLAAMRAAFGRWADDGGAITGTEWVDKVRSARPAA
jgi:hypothetical protein